MEKVSGTVNYEFEVLFTETVAGNNTVIALTSNADVVHAKGLEVTIPTDLWAYDPIKTIIRVMLKDRLQDALSLKVGSTVQKKG